jgi:outer membrane lipoprotein-sorting protein
MNCAECRDNLVAYAEGLLESEESLKCAAHLESCSSCQGEYQSVVHLQERLIARGQAAADVSLAGPVMQRVLHQPEKLERNTIMSLLMKHRWGFGLGAAAAAAVIALVVALLPSGAQATAVEVLTKGARAVAKLRSIHLRCQLRTLPSDNFEAIMPERDFVTVELWKQFAPELKWRVEKPGRVAVMDGKTTLMWDRNANFAFKLEQPAPSAFDTEWFHKMADLNDTLNDELRAITAHGWAVSVSAQTGREGGPKTVITVEAKSGLPDSDYLKNKFFQTADTRRVYTFDARTEVLESVRVYMNRAGGEVLVLEVSQIEYNTPIEPGIFALELPANVAWYQKPQTLPDNEKYASMTPEQAARTFFEACASGDWAEAGKFTLFPFTDRIREFLDGLQLVSIGTAFGSAVNADQFVPYEIKFKNGGVKKFNLALCKDEQTGRWMIDGGL